MTVLIACSVITLLAAAAATFVGDLKRAVLALWIAGLGVGGLYLSLGAELLAVTQWIVATLVAISFVFYTVMFGEYGQPDPRSLARRAAAAVLPLALGAAFTGVIWLGARHLEPQLLEKAAAQTEGAPEKMVAIGRALAGGHLLSLEVLALTLLIVVVGSGVVARPEPTEPGDQP